MSDPVLFVYNNHRSSKILKSETLYNPDGFTQDSFSDPLSRLRTYTSRVHPGTDQMVLTIEDARRLSRKIDVFLKAACAPIEDKLIITEEDIEILKNRVSEVCGVKKEYLSVKTKNPEIVLARDLFFAFLRNDGYASDGKIGKLVRYGRTSVILATQKISNKIRWGDNRVCTKAAALMKMYGKTIDYLA